MIFVFKSKVTMCTSPFFVVYLLFSIMTLRLHCTTTHTQPCSKCSALCSVSSHISEYGSLSDAYKSSFPSLDYRSQNALQLFLQMPLVAVRIGAAESGTSAWYLLEFIDGVNYTQVVQFMEATLQQSVKSIEKHELKSLLGLAQSDRERELIRYSVFKTLRTLCYCC